jgi:hypothetical protein
MRVEKEATYVARSNNVLLYVAGILVWLKTDDNETVSTTERGILPPSVRPCLVCF